MPDIIITPSSGIIDFFPVSTRVGRIEGSGNTINVLNPSGYVAVSGSGMSINTSSPNALFHAYSSVSGATILNLEGTNGSLFSVIDNLSGSLMSVNNNAGLPVFEVFSDDRVVAGRFGQNDFIITSGGNVGIGTGVPSSKFHVVGTSTFNGDVSSTGSFIAGSGTAALPSFEFINDVDTGLFSPATNTFGISTSGVERLRIDSVGRLGIGTSSPSSTLQVSGLITANSGNFTQSLQVNGTGVSISGHTHTVSDITNFGSGVSGLLPSNLVYTTGNQTISGIKTFSNINSDTISATINLSGPAGFQVTDENFFFVNANNNFNVDTEIGVANFYNMYLNGTNVGIGTATPSYTLHVEGAASFNSINSDWNSLDNEYWIQTDGQGSISAEQLLLGYLGPGNGRQASISCGYVTPLSISNGNSQPIIFNLDSIEKFRISNSGIGINTNNPTYQLHVNGSGIVASGLQVNRSLSLNGSGIGLYDTSVFNLGTISGTNAINCGQDRQIQTLTLNGVATTFTTGTGWPSSNSVSRETTLNIFASGNTSVTWTIVNDWYRQPDSPLPSGRHIVLLRSVGSGNMQGHYIGNKTN